MLDNGLIIFARYPDPNSVKTRLSPALNDDERIALYIKMMKGTIERFGHLKGINTFIFYTPIGSVEYFSKFGLKTFPQEGLDQAAFNLVLDLGRRMFNAITHILNLGYKRVSIIGTDCPDLTPETINEGFDRLIDNDLVIGPAMDGGYYLIGMKSGDTRLFTDISWSTDKVTAQTLTKAKEIGLSYYLLKTYRDIDRPEDLRYILGSIP